MRYKTEEFKTNGWDTILQLIENLPSFDPANLPELGSANMNSAQIRKFHRKHKYVSLTFKSSGEIYLMPYEKDYASDSGSAEEEIYLTPPITNESFWEKLTEAFEKSD